LPSKRKKEKKKGQHTASEIILNPKRYYGNTYFQVIGLCQGKHFINVGSLIDTTTTKPFIPKQVGVG
jgi:hypothetical protein